MSCPDSRKMRTKKCKLKKHCIILMQKGVKTKSFGVLTNIWLYIYVHMYAKLNISGSIR